MRPGRAVLAGLPLLLAVGSCDAPPHDRGRLLVTSGFTDQVFVLDAATGAVLDSLSLDRRPGERDEPHGVAVAPDGRLWYATLSHGEATPGWDPGGGPGLLALRARRARPRRRGAHGGSHGGGRTGGVRGAPRCRVQPFG
jgi:hypothetical protein